MGRAASGAKVVIGPMGIVDQHLLPLRDASNACHLRFPANSSRHSPKYVRKTALSTSRGGGVG
jgi:hypothetical protein